MPLFFFTGDESYLLQREVQLWKDRFADKYGAEHIHTHSIRDESESIAQSLIGGGLFGAKTLAILHDVPPPAGMKGHAERFVDHSLPLLEQLSDDTVVICISPSPDKRTKLYKKITTLATLKTFAPLKAAALNQFVVDTYGETLPTTLINSIKTLCGTSLSHLASEIMKLRQYIDATGETLTPDLIAQICVSTYESNAFGVLDALVTDPSASIDHLTALQAEGQDIYQIMGMLLRGLRNSLAITQLARDGQTNAGTIAKTLKVAPFVASKQLKKITTYRALESQLRLLFVGLVEIDDGLKTGRYDARSAWGVVKSVMYEVLISTKQ